jgi:hypothetical protein
MNPFSPALSLIPYRRVLAILLAGCFHSFTAMGQAPYELKGITKVEMYISGIFGADTRHSEKYVVPKDKATMKRLETFLRSKWPEFEWIEKKDVDRMIPWATISFSVVVATLESGEVVRFKADGPDILEINVGDRTDYYIFRSRDPDSEGFVEELQLHVEQALSHDWSEMTEAERSQFWATVKKTSSNAK